MLALCLKCNHCDEGTDNREYEGKVINVKENIALLSAKDFYMYVHKPERLLKIAVQ